MPTHIPSSPGFSLNNPAKIAWIFQLLTVIAVIGFGWVLYDDTHTNLVHRSITTRFSFLQNTAGLVIAQHWIDYR